MRTSADVYHRVLHDTSLSIAADTTIGYLDRFRGTRETPLLSFAKTAAEIPWHRVLYLRSGSEFLWHKETRLDAIFHSTDPAIAATSDSIAAREADLACASANALEDEEARLRKTISPRHTRPPATAELKRVPVYRFSAVSHEWTALDSLAAQPAHAGSLGTSPLTIGTINVLHSYHMSMESYILDNLRWRVIVDSLCEAAAAIWVITEATPDFARFLQANTRIRDMYAASDGPSCFSTLRRHRGVTGQLILVRRDIAVQSVHFYEEEHSAKCYVFAVVQLPHGPSVAIAAVHLTSGKMGKSETSTAVSKRRVQLTSVLRLLEGLSTDKENPRPCDVQVVAGDFNFHPVDKTAGEALMDDFCETGDPLPTFDPSGNDLAARCTLRTEPRRFDRIYARFNKECLGAGETVRGLVKAVEHRVILDSPITIPDSDILDDAYCNEFPSRLFPSDHFGIVTYFEILGRSLPSGSKHNWTMSTALAILPDKDAQKDIDDWMRCEMDPSYGKWPPHVNVLFPFIAPDLIDRFATEFSDTMRLNGCASPQKDRNIVFNDVIRFRHRRANTVSLAMAAGEGTLKSLHGNAMSTAERVTGCPPPEIKGRPPEWTPHLKLAKLQNADIDVDDFVAATRRQFLAEKKGVWDIRLRSLAVLQKIDGKMQIVKSIPLYSPSTRGSMVKKTLLFIRALARRVFAGRSDFRIVPVGSVALTKGRGTMGDVDIVLIPPPSRVDVSATEFTDATRDILVDATPGCIRCVGDAICPIIALDLTESYDVLPVDIMYGETRFALEAIADSDALVTRANSLVERSALTFELFADVLCKVKTWADAKMLTQRGYTLFAGVSWSIMVLVSVEAAVERDHCMSGGVSSLLVEFFRKFSTFDFKNLAVTIDGHVERSGLGALDPADQFKAGCVVITPASLHNVNRTVPVAVVNDAQREMRVALDLLLRARSANLENWDAYIGTALSGSDLASAYRSCIVVCVADVGEANFHIVDGWLRGRFAHFVNQELGGRGIAVRPASRLVKSTSGVSRISYKLICGVCEKFTTALFGERKRLVAHATATLHDRFLRWEGRPLVGNLSVTLIDQHSTKR